MHIVVDVKTIETDVFACYIYFLLADVIVNAVVVDVITTCYSIRRYLYMADVFAMYVCGRCYYH